MVSDQTPGEDESLAESFWRVARTLRGMSRESLAPWDINPSHARALAVLARHGTMRLSELSEHLRIAARSATEVVDALQERGLAERHADPHDRRATLVALTAQGSKVAHAIRTARQDDAAKLFGGLSETDRKALGRILRKLGDGHRYVRES